jgi:hypothetical protein
MILGSFRHIPYASNLHHMPNIRGTWYLPLQYMQQFDTEFQYTSYMANT